MDSCTPKIDLQLFQHYSLIPTGVIIAILHGYEYHKTHTFRMTTPFLSLLDNDKNRKMIVLGFGAMATSIIQLLVFNTTGTSNNTSTSNVMLNLFLLLLNILEVGMINFPIFACITSPYVLVASFLGFIYTLWKLILLLLVSCDINCSDKYIIWNLFKYLPSLICLFLLCLYFAKHIYKCIKKREYEQPIPGITVMKIYQLEYLKNTLHKHKQLSHINETHSRLKRMHQRIKTAFPPYFRYSTVFISAIVVVLIVYYYYAVLGIYGANALNIYVPKLLKMYNLTDQAVYVNTAGGIYVIYNISLVATALAYIGILVHLLYSHQNNLLMLYSGKDTNINYQMTCESRIRLNLLFPGYLVAYMVWGMFFFFVVFCSVSVVVYCFFVAAIEMKVVGKIVVLFLKYMISFFVIPVLVYVVQFLLVHFVFRERQYATSVVIKHLKLYHITLYFTIFFNVVIGLYSCLTRSLKSLIVSLLFLGRIDKTSMIFFKGLDTGHMAYIGFLHVQAAFKNPIMHCFCQMLLDANGTNSPATSRSNDDVSLLYDRNTDEHIDDDSHKNKVAYNRWFLAVTLINNPTLMQLRKSGRICLIEESRSTTEERKESDSLSYVV